MLFNEYTTTLTYLFFNIHWLLVPFCYSEIYSNNGTKCTCGPVYLVRDWMFYQITN